MERERIKSLDGLRAFAIIFVLLSHSSWKFQAPIILRIGSADFQNFLYNGWAGVDLFFVLSGFLIASQLLKKPLNRENLKNFLGKRYFRIAPAYYVSVFLALILLHILPALNEKPLSELLSTWWIPVLAHVTFLHDYIGRNPPIDGLFWSIPVEIKFYMFLPVFIFLLAKLKKNTHQIYSIVGFYSLYVMSKTGSFYVQHGFNNIQYSDYFMDVKTPFHLALDGLTIGVLCAFLIRNEKIKQIEKDSKIPNFAFFMGLALFSALSLSPHFIGEVASFFECTIMTSLFSLSFGLALIGLVKGCIATTFFSNFVLRFIAQISYSMYLTHVYALYFQTAILEKLKTFIESTTLCWLISLPIFFGVAICIAYILHSYVEKPCIEWSRKRWSSSSK